MAAAGNDSQVRIYEQENGQYSLSQTITAGFRVYFLKITEENLLVSGNSTQLLFYIHNGEEYELHETMDTGASPIKYTPVSNNFQELAYGNSTILRNYKRNEYY